MLAESLEIFAPGLPRIAIVGSRIYKRTLRVREWVAAFPRPFVLISGGAAGVDTAAERAARERGLAVLSIVPDLGWTLEERDAQILAASQRVVVFWSEVRDEALATIKAARRTGKLWAVYGSTGQRLSPEALADALQYCADKKRRAARRR